MRRASNHDSSETPSAAATQPASSRVPVIWRGRCSGDAPEARRSGRLLAACRTTSTPIHATPPTARTAPGTTRFHGNGIGSVPPPLHVRAPSLQTTKPDDGTSSSSAVSIRSSLLVFFMDSIVTPPSPPIPSRPAHLRDAETASSAAHALLPAELSSFPPAFPWCVRLRSHPSHENKTGLQARDSAPVEPALPSVPLPRFAVSPNPLSCTAARAGSGASSMRTSSTGNRFSSERNTFAASAKSHVEKPPSRRHCFSPRHARTSASCAISSARPRSRQYRQAIFTSGPCHRRTMPFKRIHVPGQHRSTSRQIGVSASQDASAAPGIVRISGSRTQIRHAPSGRTSPSRTRLHFVAWAAQRFSVSL